MKNKSSPLSKMLVGGMALATMATAGLNIHSKNTTPSYQEAWNGSEKRAYVDTTQANIFDGLIKAFTRVDPYLRHRISYNLPVESGPVTFTDGEGGSSAIFLDKNGGNYRILIGVKDPTNKYKKIEIIKTENDGVRIFGYQPSNDESGLYSMTELNSLEEIREILPQTHSLEKRLKDRPRF